MLINMAASRSKVAVLTVAFIISLTFLPLIKSDGSVISGQNSGDSDNQSLFQRKMALGSKPPACVNKCLSCRPCVATLVVPSNHQKKFKDLRASSSSPSSSSSSHGEDDTYYLLSWKCRCGNKLFQP